MRITSRAHQFSTGVSFAPKRHLVMPGDISAYHKCWGRCYWHLMIEAKDATKLSTVHKTGPTMKDYRAQEPLVLRVRGRGSTSSRSVTWELTGRAGSPALPSPALPCPALPCPALPCPALPCPAESETGRRDVRKPPAFSQCETHWYSIGSQP